MTRHLVAVVVCFLLAGVTAAEERALVGITGSDGMGECGLGFVGTVDARRGPVSAELWGSTQDKCVTDAGWQADVAADGWLGRVSLGGRISHRNGGPWSKRRYWLRAGLQVGWLRLIYSHAFGGPEDERKAEARLALRRGRFVLETRAFVTHHHMGWGHGAQTMVGVAWGGGR